MDVEIIKALSGLPIEIVLIYVIFQQQKQIEKLLAGIIESEREHARNLVSIVVGNHDNLVSGRSD